jgi:hypothetical protein
VLAKRYEENVDCLLIAKLVAVSILGNPPWSSEMNVFYFSLTIGSSLRRQRLSVFNRQGGAVSKGCEIGGQGSLQLCIREFEYPFGEKVPFDVVEVLLKSEK